MINIFFKPDGSLKENITLPDYFSLFQLKIAYFVNLTALENSFEEYILELHPDFFANASSSQKTLSLKYSAIVKQAKDEIANPYTRAIYLCKYLHKTPKEEELKQPQNFLLKMLEVRELIETPNALKTQKKLIFQLKTEYQELQKKLQELFDKFIKSENKKDLFLPLSQAIGKIKYYKNIAEQLESFK